MSNFPMSNFPMSNFPMSNFIVSSGQTSSGLVIGASDGMIVNGGTVIETGAKYHREASSS
jgi:hypothetical protein